MRMIVFFDLPVSQKSAQRAATRFRNFLLKDGYYMVQYSVYARVCNGYDNVEVHRKRLMDNLPDNGSVRLLTITEKHEYVGDVRHPEAGMLDTCGGKNGHLRRRDWTLTAKDPHGTLYLLLLMGRIGQRWRAT